MVERTLPKPDTRVRFPSAARINHKPLASVRGFRVPNLRRESLPGADLVPRPLGIRILQPVSRSQKFWYLPGLFYFPQLAPRAGGF